MLGGHYESLHDLHSIHFPILMYDSHITLYVIECYRVNKSHFASWKGESVRLMNYS